MSRKLTMKAWQTGPEIKGMDRLLLVCLAESAQESAQHGICWASDERLAKLCASSKRSVQRALKRLSDAGIIRIAANSEDSPYPGRRIIYVFRT